MNEWVSCSHISKFSDEEYKLLEGSILSNHCISHSLKERASLRAGLRNRTPLLGKE